MFFHILYLTDKEQVLPADASTFIFKFKLHWSVKKKTVDLLDIVVHEL